MYCARCGKQVDESWTTCAYCGKRISTAQSYSNLEKCDKKNLEKISLFDGIGTMLLSTVITVLILSTILIVLKLFF